MKISDIIFLSVLFFTAVNGHAAIGHGGHGSAGGAYGATPVVNHIEDKAAMVAASKFLAALATQNKRIEGEQLDAAWNRNR